MEDVLGEVEVVVEEFGEVEEERSCVMAWLVTCMCWKLLETSMLVLENAF